MYCVKFQHIILGSFQIILTINLVKLSGYKGLQTNESNKQPININIVLVIPSAVK